MKKVDLSLFVIGMFGIIFSVWILPSLNETNIRAEYDKYYEQAKNEIECNKIETQAVCNKVSEDIDVTTKQSFMRYSFFTDDYDFTNELYYDTDIDYKTDNKYDCNLYHFSCIVYPHHSVSYNVLVIGNGTTNYNNKSFDFDKTVDECLEKFTKKMIEHKIDSYSTLYIIISSISSLVFGWSLISLVSYNKKTALNKARHLQKD